MVERLFDDPTTPSSYHTRFDEFHSKIEVLEFEGTLGQAVSDLEAYLKKCNEDNYFRRIVLSYLITKTTIDEKNAADDRKSREMEAPMLGALILSNNLENTVYREDPLAIGKLRSYKSYIENAGFNGMLERTITETMHDEEMMPADAGEKDREEAEKVLGKIGDAKTIVIGIGHRGEKRARDAANDLPNAHYWPIRYHRGDLVPRLSELEKVFLINEARGCKIVVAGPPDTFIISIYGIKKNVNRLTAARGFFSTMVFGTEKEPAEVIPLPIVFTKPAGYTNLSRQIYPDKKLK